MPNLSALNRIDPEIYSYLIENPELKGCGKQYINTKIFYFILIYLYLNFHSQYLFMLSSYIN